MRLELGTLTINIPIEFTLASKVTAKCSVNYIIKHGLLL